MKLIILSLLLAASGCAHGLGVRELYRNPANKQVYEAACHGTRNTIGDCQKQAYETCKGNFTETGKDARDGIVSVNGQLYPVLMRTIQFTCN